MRLTYSAIHVFRLFSIFQLGWEQLGWEHWFCIDWFRSWWRGFGFSVSGARDINGDGLDDLLIGSSIGNTVAFVVFGRMSSSFPGSLDLSELEGTNGFLLAGIDAGDSIPVIL